MPVPPESLDTSNRDEARELLASLEDVDLERYSVAGPCLRFDERSRNTLKEFRQRLAQSFLSRSSAPKNFLVWGAPGSGKSYMVQQVAKSLQSKVRYLELNLAQEDATSLRSRLDAFMATPGPALGFIDEVDTRSDQAWPYETLLPYLDPPIPRPYPTVFCLAGSRGTDLREFIQQIRSRPKGSDLLSRIPEGNELTIDALGLGDKILVSVMQLLLAAQEEGHHVREIEKLALYYLAVHPSLTSARQLRIRAAECAQRIPPAETRIRYDYLFAAGDPENHRFWTEVVSGHAGLENLFVRIVPGSLLIELRPDASRPRVPPPESAIDASSTPKLAVLPLANISPDPKDEYFADGLTEELIMKLSQIKGLRVTSRTSVGQYKGTTKSVEQIGSELGVGAVLEGSVRKAGDQLRITGQLIDVGSDQHRWAHTYDRRLENVFTIQAEVAEGIAHALQIELLKSEREAIHERPTENLSAYEFYLRGIQAQQRIETDRVTWERQAECYFEEAIRRDPQFSQAYAALANHLLETLGETRPAREVSPRVRHLVARALELNPNSPDGHAASGNLAMQVDLDWGRAEAEFQQAIALNPSNSSARLVYGMLLLLLQRFKEAEKQLLLAINLDPLSILPKRYLIMTYLYSGNFDAASPLCQKAVEIYGASPFLRQWVAQVYVETGRPEDAAKLVEPLAGTRDLPARMDRSMVLATLGRPEEARALLAEWEEGRLLAYIPRAELAERYALCGEREKALALLERDFREGDRDLWFSYQSMAFDTIRDDPRFVALLHAMNLPTGIRRRRTQTGG